MASGDIATLPDAKAPPHYGPFDHRCAHLYRISEILAEFETSENPIESVFSVVSDALPIRSAILTEEAEGPSPVIRSWASKEMRGDELQVARTYAAAMHEYFLSSDETAKGNRPGWNDGSDRNFIVIPLVVGHRPVFGILQVECLLQAGEGDIAFLNAVANQMAVALDLHNTRQREATVLRSLNEFVGIAAHDLKGPIQNILGLSNLICSGRKPERHAGFLASIILSTERMNRLINDLLDHSMTESKKIDFATIDLARMTNEVWQDLAHFADEKNAVLTVDRLPFVRAGRFQVRQLLQNLLGNAIKYSLPGEPPRIQVCGRAMKKGPLPFVEVSIMDNGIGFAPEISEKIFEPFVRLHGSSEYEGTGLGLAICRKIVERHGGSITATGREGEGCTFTFSLPAARTEELTS